MKLNNLQILRGISALLVCCFHFRDDINFSHLKLGEILFSKGSIGVPVFFVISGFIMVFTTQKINFEKEHIARQVISFYKKRIIRIIPLYYLLTFCWIIIGGSIADYFSGEQFSRLLHSLLFLPDKHLFPVLFLGWSLNYEMFFYVIFGISLFFTGSRYIFIMILMVSAYIAGLIFSFENPFLKMATNVLNLHFVTGMLLGLFFVKSNVSRPYAAIISSAGILLFALMFFKVAVIEKPFLSMMIVSLFVLSFLLFDFSLKYKGAGFLIFLGDISYSLYLSHPFVDIIFKKIKIHNDLLRIPFFLLKVVTVIIIAAALYHFVEKKMTNYLKIKCNA